MRRLADYEGRSIRLTDERLAHILLHPEMVGTEDALAETLAHPQHVIQSFSDPNVQLYYGTHPETRMADKLLCVVVKMRGEDAFVRHDGVSH